MRNMYVVHYFPNQNFFHAPLDKICAIARTNLSSENAARKEQSSKFENRSSALRLASLSTMKVAFYLEEYDREIERDLGGLLHCIS